MRSTLKLTLTALAVSVALTGCKSTEGTRVVEKPKAIQTQAVENPEKPAKSDSTSTSKPAKPTAPVTPVKPVVPFKPTEPAKPVEPSKPMEPAKPIEPTEPTKPVTPTAVKAVNEDSSGKYWRVIPLSTLSSPSDAGDARREEREHFVMPSWEDGRSPFVADENDKERNSYLILDLGTNKKSTPFTISLQQPGASYLGKHEGQYKDSKLLGKKIIGIDEDDEVVTEHVDAINYLYINQPYSSYGALYTNENDSNLFHIRLSTGRDGKRVGSEGNSGSSYSEYGVWDLVNGSAKWNNELIGEATYKGDVIARIVENRDGKAVAHIPKLDGSVEITLNLNNDWDKSRLKGEINSNTLGMIELTESQLGDSRYFRDFISFSGEAKATNHEALSGDYRTQLVGQNLNDVVGNITIENDDTPNNGIIKYDAVFGGTKQ